MPRLAAVSPGPAIRAFMRWENEAGRKSSSEAKVENGRAIQVPAGRRSAILICAASSKGRVRVPW
jgi:hypothetical protein